MGQIKDGTTGMPQDSIQLADVPYDTQIFRDGNNIKLTYDNVTHELIPVYSTGYTFASWTFDPVGMIVKGDTTITAKFKSDGPTPGETFTVSIIAMEHGSVDTPKVWDVPSGTNYVFSGSLLLIGTNKVTATADYGYKFMNWTTDASTQGKITADTQFFATFQIDQFAISATTDGNGTITGDLSSADYNSDYTVNNTAGTFTIGDKTITATATDTNKYEFSHWEMNGEKLENGKVTADMNIKAIFKLKTFTVSFESDPHG